MACFGNFCKWVKNQYAYFGERSFLLLSNYIVRNLIRLQENSCHNPFCLTLTISMDTIMK